jgi:hypothetical protein
MLKFDSSASHKLDYGLFNQHLVTTSSVEFIRHLYKEVHSYAVELW